jgi:cell wall-associated NlpC family hydrolase
MPAQPLTTVSIFLRRGALASAVLVCAALLAACGTRPVRSPEPAPAVPVSARLSEHEAQQVVIAALGLVGTPYRYGGNTPEGGFDCSGLIGYVYRNAASLSPPRTVAALDGWGQAVPAEDLRAGDLVLFANGGPPTHAGIYVGDNRFVHAPSSGGQVRLDRLDARHWARQRISYRRP